MNKLVSIVLCTYNGERFLREQLDTLLSQTYPIHEIIIQDDGSTDSTPDILREYADKHPVIHVFQNEADHGVNGNFFSAMKRATGDYIAICDQDDIWESNKIERQIAAIGSQLLCACRSIPFSADGTKVAYDPRTPNYHLIRLLYASIPGHTMLFHRSLLEKLPPNDNQLKTYYDVYLSLTAAALGGLVLLDEFLVKQRRYVEATTSNLSAVDTRRTPSVGNGLYILRWSILHYRQVRPYLYEFFQRRLILVSRIPAEGELFEDAKRIVSLEGQKGLLNLLRLCRLHIKYRHHLFYAEGKGIVNFLRAAIYCMMVVYNYQFLMPSSQTNSGKPRP